MNQDKQALIFSEKTYEKYSSDKEKQPDNKTNKNLKIPLTDAVEDFTLMAKVDGRSEKTLDLYNYVFKNFLNYHQESTPINKINPKDIRSYLAHLMDKDLKNTTVAIHHRVLQAFFNWLVAEEQLRESAMENIDEPKTPNKFPKVLNEEQIEQLLYTAKNWRKT